MKRLSTNSVDKGEKVSLINLPKLKGTKWKYNPFLNAPNQTIRSFKMSFDIYNKIVLSS